MHFSNPIDVKCETKISVIFKSASEYYQFLSYVTHIFHRGCNNFNKFLSHLISLPSGSFSDIQQLCTITDQRDFYNYIKYTTIVDVVMLCIGVSGDRGVVSSELDIAKRKQ